MYAFSPTHGERFYNLIDKDKWFESFEEEIIDTQVPSVTTVLGVWPKGEEFQRWLASRETYADAVAERNAGGRRGKRVHEYIEKYIKGEPLVYHEFRNEFHRGDDFAAYDEWRRLESFVEWHEQMGYPNVVSFANGKPAIERTLYSWKHGYAGTADLVVTGGIFGSANVLIDFKTGKSIYLSFWAQTSAYARSWEEMGGDHIDAAGIILFGGLERKAWKFEMVGESDIAPWCADFDAAHRIWRRENQKTGIRDGERWWGEVRSERKVYVVEDVLKIAAKPFEGEADEDESPAWAKRPEKARSKIVIP